MTILNPKPSLTPGCYIDSHNGHYSTIMVIEFAKSVGYLVDPFVQWALDSYHRHSHEEQFPNDALIEECDDAIAFLNEEHSVPGHTWAWYEGDFGLYPDEDDDG